MRMSGVGKLSENAPYQASLFTFTVKLVDNKLIKPLLTTLFVDYRSLTLFLLALRTEEDYVYSLFSGKIFQILRIYIVPVIMI